MNSSSYDANGRPLVPQAERPFIPEAELESVQETVWFNPTDRDCVLNLYVGVKPRYSQQGRDAFKALPPARQLLERRGEQRWIIRKGERRAIPCEFDFAIQQTMCQEPDCPAPNRLYCRDMTHHAMVLGGLGPQLLNEKRQFRAVVHTSLVEAHSSAELAKAQAIEAYRLKEAADAAMLVAQTQLEKARILDAQAKAHETQPNPQGAPAPNAQSKKEK